MSTPREDGFFMPAEWAPHTRCWMAYPCREELWGERLAAARDAYAEVAKAVARFEKVTMLCAPEEIAEISLKCGAGVACVPVPLDDSWTRDSGPTFLVDREGRLAGVDWIFNAWGERFRPFDQDAALARAIIERTEAVAYSAPLVTEGGAIHSDGEGTLLVVEQTLLNENRNPGRSREEVEGLLKDYTGATKVVWLPCGLVDDETDGHIDNVACFARPGVVLAMTTDDKDDPNCERLQANLEVLRSATDAQGRPLEVVTLPQPKLRLDDEGRRMALSYINFYVANGAIIMPEFGESADNRAYDVIAAQFPGREVVQVPALDILYGGGGIHCITQQQPDPAAFVPEDEEEPADLEDDRET